MSLAEILDAARIDGAFCATADPEIWWKADFAPHARHFCLAHCAALNECRQQMKRWVAPGSVAAGIQWANSRAGVRVAREQPAPLQCLSCLNGVAPSPRADLNTPRLSRPVDPPRNGRRPGNAYLAEMRRLAAALAAS